MEEITNYEGITHKMIIPEDNSDSIDLAVLTGFMMQACIFLKFKDDTLKELFLKLISKGSKDVINAVKNIFKSLDSLPVENFGSILPEILSIKHIFFETRIFNIDTPQDSRLYILSKKLKLMIIEKQESKPDKFYCCSDSTEIIKLIIINEGNNYFPGFNINELNPENLFFKYPAKTKDDDKETFKLLKKKIMSIIEFISPDSKSSLVSLIKKCSNDYFKAGSLSNFSLDLGKKINCHDSLHKKSLFSCGVKHCKTCLQQKSSNSSNIECPCGITITRTNLEKLTTAPKTVMVHKKLPNESLSDRNSTNDTVNNLESDLHPIKEEAVENESEIIYSGQKDFYCWVCNRLLTFEYYRSCPDHLICESCVTRVNEKVICVTCSICRTHAFAPDTVRYNGLCYHHGCFLQNSNPPIQFIRVECWGCLNEINIADSTHCENDHYVCYICFNLRDSYCSPCYGLVCSSCDRYILKKNVCMYEELYFHDSCLSYLVNFSLNLNFS